MMRMLLAGLVFVLAAMPADAGEVRTGESRAGDVRVEDPWARASIGPAGNGAAYMTLVNEGDAPDTLVAVRSDLADAVELHTHSMDDGVMRMRPVDAIEIAADAPTVLEPGGLHVMLIGLRQPLQEGETFPLTLVFEAGGEVTVDVDVVPVRGRGHGHGHGHSHGG